MQRAAAARYTSVLPLPVMPSSRNGAYRPCARTIAATACCCASLSGVAREAGSAAGGSIIDPSRFAPAPHPGANVRRQRRDFGAAGTPSGRRVNRSNNSRARGARPSDDASAVRPSPSAVARRGAAGATARVHRRAARPAAPSARARARAAPGSSRRRNRRAAEDRSDSGGRSLRSRGSAAARSCATSLVAAMSTTTPVSARLPSRTRTIEAALDREPRWHPVVERRARRNGKRDAGDRHRLSPRSRSDTHML